MEELRIAKRKEISELRKEKRNGQQNSIRQIFQNVPEVKTESEMKIYAQNLSLKSLVTPELLIAIKNGLLTDQNNVRAFLSVDAALPALIKLISMNNVDARLQLLATHCLGNLALGDEKLCLRLVKTAGSFLVLRLSGMCHNLVDGSLWALGNLSRHGKAVNILQQQGAYSIVIKLLMTSTDAPVVRNSAMYCLTHAIQAASSQFSSEYHLNIASALLSGQIVLDSTSAYLLYQTSHVPKAAQYLVQQNIHVEALIKLHHEIAVCNSNNVPLQLTLVRILGNLSADGNVAMQLLNMPQFLQVAEHLLSSENCALQTETKWFLANVIQHQQEEASQLVSLYVG